MASIFQRGETWYFRGRNGAGKRVRIALKARNKTEAMRLTSELALKYERQRLGLEVRPDESSETLGEVMTWWLTNHSARAPAHESNLAVVTKHILNHDIASIQLHQLKATDIEAWLDAKSHDELGPQSLNHLRSFVSRAINAALKVGRYVGANPCLGVQKRKVHRKLPDYLRATEVPLVLAALPAHYRPLFATAIYTGLRKGELLALKKSDLDLESRLLTVARSGDRDTTKGGHADVIPIATELVPYLRTALAESESDLLFPDSDGKKRRRDVAFAKILRSALARAGIVEGYKHVCRRQGCGFFEMAADAEQRRCATCGRCLWPKALVRKIRFHDLRHTTASLLVAAGANTAAVRRIMRHSDPKMTDLYTHLAPEYLRTEVDRLTFTHTTPREEAQQEGSLIAANGSLFEKVTQNEPTPNFTSNSALQPTETTTRSRGLEPLTSGVTGRPLQFQPLRTHINQAQPSVFTKHKAPGVFQPFPEKTLFFKKSDPKRPHVVGLAEELLSVREAAQKLKVSSSTIYALVARGELKCVRVSNAIRISPVALAEFIGGRES